MKLLAKINTWLGSTKAVAKPEPIKHVGTIKHGTLAEPVVFYHGMKMECLNGVRVITSFSSSPDSH